VNYHTLNIPTLDVALVRAVLPYNWEEFTFTQEELQRGTSASSDTCYVPQGDQQPHLIEQSELIDLVRYLILSKHKQHFYDQDCYSGTC
jgi:hypothetical protein